jgi:hypothetical protein
MSPRRLTRLLQQQQTRLLTPPSPLRSQHLQQQSPQHQQQLRLLPKQLRLLPEQQSPQHLLPLRLLPEQLWLLPQQLPTACSQTNRDMTLPYWQHVRSISSLTVPERVFVLGCLQQP